MWKYKAVFNSVYKYKVVRETPKQIIYIQGNREIRELKKTTFHQWFNSFDEAKEHLISNRLKRIENLKRKIETNKKLIEKIKQLKDV